MTFDMWFLQADGYKQSLKKHKTIKNYSKVALPVDMHDLYNQNL